MFFSGCSFFSNHFKSFMFTQKIRIFFFLDNQMFLHRTFYNLFLIYFFKSWLELTNSPLLFINPLCGRPPLALGTSAWVSTQYREWQRTVSISYSSSKEDPPHPKGVSRTLLPPLPVDYKTPSETMRSIWIRDANNVMLPVQSCGLWKVT